MVGFKVSSAPSGIDSASPTCALEEESQRAPLSEAGDGMILGTATTVMVVLIEETLEAEVEGGLLAVSCAPSPVMSCCGPAPPDAVSDDDEEDDGGDGRRVAPPVGIRVIVGVCFALLLLLLLLSTTTDGTGESSQSLLLFRGCWYSAFVVGRWWCAWVSKSLSWDRLTEWL